MLSHHRARRGFTLVELLVVIAIIGILIALLLPAVQAAREAAKRAECTNKLKQLALAWHNYHDTHKMLPINFNGQPGTTSVVWNTTTYGRSWMQQLLPFVEQKPLYDQIDFNAPLSANLAVATTPLSILACPSDTSVRVRLVSPDLNTQMAMTSYKSVSGSNWNWGTWKYKSSVGRCAGIQDAFVCGNGVICRGSHNNTPSSSAPFRGPVMTTLADIRDGTANTFALGEMIPDICSRSGWFGPDGMHATCAHPLNHALNIGYPGNPSGWADSWQNNWGFNSYHPGGANFAMADGSVRFVAETIDTVTYRALATINAEEVVSNF